MEKKQKTQKKKHHLMPEFQVIRQSESNSKFFVASGTGGSLGSFNNSIYAEW